MRKQSSQRYWGGRKGGAGLPWHWGRCLRQLGSKGGPLLCCLAGMQGGLAALFGQGLHPGGRDASGTGLGAEDGAQLCSCSQRPQLGGRGGGAGAAREALGDLPACLPWSQPRPPASRISHAEGSLPDPLSGAVSGSVQNWGCLGLRRQAAQSVSSGCRANHGGPFLAPRLPSLLWRAAAGKQSLQGEPEPCKGPSLPAPGEGERRLPGTAEGAGPGRGGGCPDTSTALLLRHHPEEQGRPQAQGVAGQFPSLHFASRVQSQTESQELHTRKPPSQRSAKQGGQLLCLCSGIPPPRGWPRASSALSCHLAKSKTPPAHVPLLVPFCAVTPTP